MSNNDWIARAQGMWEIARHLPIMTDDDVDDPEWAGWGDTWAYQGA